MPERARAARVEGAVTIVEVFMALQVLINAALVLWIAGTNMRVDALRESMTALCRMVDMLWKRPTP